MVKPKNKNKKKELLMNLYFFKLYPKPGYFSNYYSAYNPYPPIKLEDMTKYINNARVTKKTNKRNEILKNKLELRIDTKYINKRRKKRNKFRKRKRRKKEFNN
jgi:hypothetical protein